MDSAAAGDDYMPIFYIGQHESKRALPVSVDVLRQAQDCNVGDLSPLPTFRTQTDNFYSMTCLLPQ